MNRSFNSISQFNYVAILLLTIFFCSAQVHAQCYLRDIKYNSPIREHYLPVSVKDEQGNAIAFARINGIQHPFSFSTDTLGNGVVKISTITDSVNIEAFGFESVTVAAIKLYQPIVLKANYKTIKEVVIVSDVIYCRRCRMDHYCQYHYITASTIEKEKRNDNPVSSTHALSVFPNPAPKGSTLYLRLAQNVSAPLQVQLFDAAGKSYLVAQSNISSSGLIPLQLPFHLAAGNYWVKLTNPLTKQSWAQGCVVQ
jgi:hypothetical protein